MLGDLIYLPVNWIDGMKISRAHFEQTQQHIHEQLQDNAAQQLTDFNFGILPAERSFSLSVFCDFSQQVNMELNSCKAVTPNGSRIQILPEEAVKTSTNFKDIAKKFNLQTSQSQSLFIVLSINPFNRIPAGEPLMEENPPRHPHTKAELKLDVIPAEYINAGQLPGSMVIGKIIYQNGELIHQKDFIPPCTSVNSLPALADWYNKFRQALDNWEQYCIRIIQKVNSKAQAQQPNALASGIQKLSEKMLEQLMRQKIYYQWVVSKTAPVYLCAALLQNIQFLQAVLQCYAEKDKEEMLNYFAEWTDVQAGSIENVTAKALQLQYNHSDLNFVLNEINIAYQQYLQIFQKLSLLDFIGKKKGQNIFVIEQEVKETRQQPPQQQEKPNNRWSPLS